jgi:hypothetical protein
MTAAKLRSGMHCTDSGHSERPDCRDFNGDAFGTVPVANLRGPQAWRVSLSRNQRGGGDAREARMVDLIYLDSPFNSNASYDVLFKTASGEQLQAQIEAFENTGIDKTLVEVIVLDGLK